MDLARHLELVATLALAGLVWTVQLVHYPAFRFVAREAFARFHAAHSRRISVLVGVLMPVELAAAAVLVALLPGPATAAGLALVAVIWASTAFLQMPAHRRLASGFDEGAWRRLVRTNWIRTVAWSARGVLVAGAAA